MTRVDVGIPTHGRPAYLEEAVGSVVGQTLQDWKLTISENGPATPFVQDIVRAHDGLAVEHRATGQDLGAARNASSLLQTGDAPYVAILNDDDRWDAEFLERRVAFLEANSQCALVFSTCDFIDGSGRVLERYDVGLSPGVQDRDRFLRTLYSRCVISMPTVLVARWAYDAVGPQFSETVLFYDHEMWLRIAAKFPVGLLPGSDAQYRVHPATVTRQTARLHVGERKIEVLDEVERFLPPDFPQLERRRARFVAEVRAGLDAFGRGERRAGLTWLGRAIRVHPGALFDPEIIARVWRRLRRRKRDREFWTVGS